MSFILSVPYLSISNEAFAVLPSAPDAPAVHSLERDALEDHIFGRLFNVDRHLGQPNQDNLRSLNNNYCLRSL